MKVLPVSTLTLSVFMTSIRRPALVGKRGPVIPRHGSRFMLKLMLLTFLGLTPTCWSLTGCRRFTNSVTVVPVKQNFRRAPKRSRDKCSPISVARSSGCGRLSPWVGKRLRSPRVPVKNMKLHVLKWGRLIPSIRVSPRRGGKGRLLFLSGRRFWTRAVPV